MIVACLFLSVLAGLIAAIYTLSGGFGFMSAVLAYSLVGACVLVTSLTLAHYISFLRVSSERHGVS